MKSAFVVARFIELYRKPNELGNYKSKTVYCLKAFKNHMKSAFVVARFIELTKNQYKLNNYNSKPVNSSEIQKNSSGYR